jgi:hydroxymethylbilane synthase
MLFAHAPRRLIIATRSSKLGFWRADHVRSHLAALHHNTAIGIVEIAANYGRPNAAGKSRYSKEIQNVLADGRADLAVHSLKDVPLTLAPGFTLAAVLARDDARDALVSHRYARIAELPAYAVVGMASRRRAAQLRENLPGITVEALHGDVEAKLRQLDEGNCDALIMAVAGLKRLGLASRIASLLEPDVCLPAPGQGAIAIECRSERTELIAALAPLSDRATALAITAERAFARALGSTGRAALAAYAEWEEGALWLRGLVASESGRDVLRAEIDATVAEPEEAEQLGRDLADDLLAHGAARLLAA